MTTYEDLEPRLFAAPAFLEGWVSILIEQCADGELPVLTRDDLPVLRALLDLVRDLPAAKRAGTR